MKVKSEQGDNFFKLSNINFNQVIIVGFFPVFSVLMLYLSTVYLITNFSDFITFSVTS